MDRRLMLQETLEKILESDQVYFQSPENLRMRYPAIIYSLDDIYKNSADDVAYKKVKAYQILLIYTDPDTDLLDKIISLPMCSFDRSYKADNLYHAVFTIYY